jgi:hypothetical protein
LPNRVISALGPHQDVCVYNAVGSIDVIVDVNGWFGDGTEAPTVPPGAFFYSLPPARICDTRTVVQVAGQGLVPNAGGANPPVALVANLTGVAGTAATIFTLVPDGGHRPVASDLNPRAGDVVANLAFVELATPAPIPAPWTSTTTSAGSTRSSTWPAGSSSQAPARVGRGPDAYHRS